MLSSSLQAEYIEVLKSTENISIEVSDDDLIVYSRGAEPPAYISYIGALHSGYKVRIASTTEASIHILPYVEHNKVIVFSIEHRDVRALNTVITASLLGVRSILVAPQQHEAYEERAKLRGVERVVVPSRYPLLASSVIALKSIPKLMGLRDERIRREIRELSDALKWIYERYSDIIGESRVYDVIAYTPSTKPGAYYCKASNNIQPIPLEAILDLPRGVKALVFTTTVEEQEFKDVILSSKVKGIELYTITLNTDPVTAGFYSILVAIALSKKII
ncbi:MAG: hypothetical protein QXI24_00520 [Acidilobaceae archaeon]